MTTPAISGVTYLKRGDGATPEIFTMIAEVGDIDGLALKRQMEDATSHSSAGWEEKKPTMKSGGQVKFPVNFVPSNATHSATAGIAYDWLNGTLHNYQMIYPDGTTWSFACYVAELNIKPAVKGILKADVVLDLTGPITLA